MGKLGVCEKIKWFIKTRLYNDVRGIAINPEMYSFDGPRSVFLEEPRRNTQDKLSLYFLIFVYSMQYGCGPQVYRKDPWATKKLSKKKNTVLYHPRKKTFVLSRCINTSERRKTLLKTYFNSCLKNANRGRGKKRERSIFSMSGIKCFENEIKYNFL